MKKLTSPVTYKVIFQVSFETHPKLIARIPHASEYLEKFEEWRIGVGLLIGQDIEHHCSVSVQHRTVTYEQDAPNPERAQSAIKALVPSFFNDMELTKFTRFGYRNLVIIPVDDYGMEHDSLVEILRVKFFSENEELSEIIPKPFDLRWECRTVKNNNRHRYVIQPLKNEEIFKYLHVNQENNFSEDPHKLMKQYALLTDSYPQVGLFIDLDISRQSPENSLTTLDLQDFASTMEEELNSSIGNINSYIFREGL